MTVLMIAGSPTAPSRSTYLLDWIAQSLAANRVRSDRIAVRDLPAQALLHADLSHGELLNAVAKVASASVIVIATPIYKAAYSGATKLFLDLLPQTGLAGKVVLPIATGGSPHHMLAIDYALRPVLQALGSRLVLPGIYATDTQLKRAGDAYSIDHGLETRLAEATSSLLASLCEAERSARAEREPVALNLAHRTPHAASVT